MSNVVKCLWGALASFVSSLVAGVFAFKAAAAAVPAGILFVSSGVCGFIAAVCAFAVVQYVLSYLLVWLWPINMEDAEELVYKFRNKVAEVLKETGSVEISKEAAVA